MNRILKSASLLLAAVMLASCSGQTDDGGSDTPGPGPTPGGSVTSKSLVLSSDRNLIQTFGDDYATLTVTLDGEAVTEGVTFFDGDNNVIELPDFRFSTETVGEYEIWANYGTYNSETILIKAIDIAIPQTPADPEPASTDFVSRVLLTEFTTVGCSACPAMKTVLHELEGDEELGGSVVFTECHSGLVNSVADPCYLHDTAFEEFCMVGSFPTVKFGLDKTLKDYSVKSAVRELLEVQKDVAPGIAVNSAFEDDKIVAKVTVKARAASSYRVGAFLLEDGIYAVQTSAGDNDWMHTHNNVIRYVDASYRASFYGHPVAEIPAGGTADIMFSWILDDIWAYGSEKGEVNGGIAWPERKNENLHMVIFVSMSDGDGGYTVVNARDIRNLDGETPFEYR